MPVSSNGCCYLFQLIICYFCSLSTKFGLLQLPHEFLHIRSLSHKGLGPFPYSSMSPRIRGSNSVISASFAASSSNRGSSPRALRLSLYGPYFFYGLTASSRLSSFSQSSWTPLRPSSLQPPSSCLHTSWLPLGLTALRQTSNPFQKPLLSFPIRPLLHRSVATLQLGPLFWHSLVSYRFTYKAQIPSNGHRVCEVIVQPSPKCQ